MNTQLGLEFSEKQVTKVTAALPSGSPTGDKDSASLPLATAPGCAAPAPAAGSYGDLRDTNNLVRSKPGMFWCYCHLQDLPLTEQSADPRYCHQCLQVLQDEVKTLSSTHRKQQPWWLPTAKTQHQTNPAVPLQGGGIMSTVKSENSTVDKIKVHPSFVYKETRGRKQQQLPVEKISEMAAAGMGSKAASYRV